MNRNHIEMAINNLKVSHKIFHSEADFQFSLAWELQKILPNAKIRLEYCPIFDDNMHIDIYVIDEGYSYPIELKYKTKEIKVPNDGEQYNLKNQFAHDIGRYDFLYDISRIEKAKALDENFESGFAIILTNDSAYWSSPYTKNTVDASFRIHEGRTITGSLSWGEKAGNGTTKGREESIELIGNYKITWVPFSNIEAPHGEFRYCMIEV